MTDFETFVLDNRDSLFAFEVYRRVFTPYEMEKKFRDQSEFEGFDSRYGKILGAIELPDKDILLGIREVDEDNNFWGHVEFYKLSEIRLRRVVEEE